MMKVFRSIPQSYRRLIRSRMINRIVVFCILMALFVSSVLFWAIQSRMSAILKEQAVTDSTRTLVTAEKYFTDKFEAQKEFHYWVYWDSEPRQKLADYFSKGAHTPGEEIAFTNWVSGLMGRQVGDWSGALAGAYFYNIAEGRVLPILERRGSQRRDSYLPPMIQQALGDIAAGNTVSRIYTAVTFAYDQENKITGGTLSLYNFVRDPNKLNNIVGLISFHFDINEMTNELLNQMSLKSAGTILLVTDSMLVLYDSSGGYNESKYAAILEKAHGYGEQIDTSDGVAGILHNSRFGFSVVNIVPSNVLYAAIRPITLFILLLMGAALAAIIAATLLFSRGLSGRVKSMSAGIGQIEAGRLGVELPVSGLDDELDLISRNLNHMQSRLKEQLRQEDESRRQKEQALLSQKDAEMYALQAQINPHFLYNMLEIARMKAVTDGARETAMMIRILAEIFRRNVGRSVITAVEEELEYCSLYGELFAVHNTNGLITEIDVSPEIKKYYIPTHILQPILENALIHGATNNGEEVVIQISGKPREGGLLFMVTDNGAGMAPDVLDELHRRLASGTINSDGCKIGICNVNQRLKLLFGDEYGVTIDSQAGVGTKVTILMKAMDGTEFGSHV